LKKLGLPIFLVLLAAVGFWSYRQWVPDDATIIARRIGKLGALASISSKESSLVRLARCREIAGCFSHDARIDWETDQLRGSNEVFQRFYLFRTTTPSVQARVVDLDVAVDTSGEQAEANFTVIVDLGTEKFAIVEEVHFRLQKIDGEWLVAEAKASQPLRQ
jgi:hypothetical protein